MRRLSGLLAPPLAFLACTAPLRSPPGTAWARVGPAAHSVVERSDGAVLVHFPHGTCGTGWLEIQVLVSAETNIPEWVGHPDGDRLRTGSCRFETPERLLNETRVRCFDPAGRRSPSEWVVGVGVTGSEPSESCPGAVMP